MIIISDFGSDDRLYNVKWEIIVTKSPSNKFNFFVKIKLRANH